jgi:hypothetical protein
MPTARLAALLLIVVIAAACNDKPSTAGSASASSPTPTGTALIAGNRAPTIDVENPQLCVGCHAAIVAEWSESMHAMADASKDPIYGAMRELRRNKQGEETAARCLNCHGPRSVLMKRPELAMHGVSCASCHNVVHVTRSKGVGAKALVLAGAGELLGPHDVKPGFSPVHGTGPAPQHMRDGSSLCLACHDLLKTPAGLDACTTGPEWMGAAASDGTSTGSCVSCHMPVVNTPSGSVTQRREHRSHQFLGPHRAWLQQDLSLLQQGVTMHAAFKEADVEVTLQATSGHAFPSGFPGRFAKLVVVPKDASGKALAELPPVMLNKVYVDAEGKPAPAAFATELKSDTRLLAGERRTVLVTGIPVEASTVDVKLLYGLLPPPLATTLGVAGRAEGSPVVLASTTLTR